MYVKPLATRHLLARKQRRRKVTIIVCVGSERHIYHVKTMAGRLLLGKFLLNLLVTNLKNEEAV